MEGGFNSYVYATNDPVLYVDQIGENPLLFGVFAYGLYKHWTRHDYNPVASRSSLVDAGLSPLPRSKSIFHQLGGADDNQKFVWGEDNQYEAVYDGENCLVTDSLNMGTYNYFNPTGNVLEQGMHLVADVVPYMIFGNTPYDFISGFDDRIGALVQ